MTSFILLMSLFLYKNLLILTKKNGKFYHKSYSMSAALEIFQFCFQFL